MTDEEYAALQRREADQAWRQAAHLVGLLAVDDDPDGFSGAMGDFAEQSDTIFAAAVVAACSRMVAELLAPHPLDARRAVLMSVIANHSSFDLGELGDLGEPADPS